MNQPADAEVARLRVPPHSMEAEQSLLGGLLLDNKAWDHVADAVREGDFYNHAHRLVFGAIGDLVTVNKPADVVTVFAHLHAQRMADDCGGLAYLNALAQSVPSAANIRRYAEIVRERAVLRRLIETGDEIVTQAFNPAGRPVTQILDESESKILAIGEEGARQRTSWQGMDEIAVRLIDRVAEMAENGARTVTGVSTGFADLDRLTSGLQAGELIILAARPSMGKTALALNIAESVGLHAGMTVLVFSMEMGADQLGMRLAGSVGRVDQQNLRTGDLQPEEWGRLTEAVDKLSKVPIYIDESGALNTAELRARARRKARQCEGRLGLVVVDYLQLMSPAEVEVGARGAAENRATVLGEISRGLKSLAKELRCPVVALSQLNRQVESRPDKRPLMSDLRESGALEQDADVIMFIYRDEYYNKDSKDKGIAELIVAKQRNGPVGTIKLQFSGQYTRFSSFSSP